MSERLYSSRLMNADFPFNIHRVVHDARHTPNLHSHDFIELVYVEHGAARHIFEDVSYELRAGNVFIINPGESHTFEIDDDARLCIINCLFQPHLIHQSVLRELNVSDSMDYFYIHPFLNSRERFNHLLRLRGDEATRVLSVLETMIQELNQRFVGYQTLIRLRMIELLMLLSRYYTSASCDPTFTAAENRRTVVQRICGYLERHYQQKLALDSLAELFNVSTRQLNRIFREELGISVVEKIQQIRVEKAKMFLTATDEKVITVAAMVGYDDPAFFSRLFTREVGCAPGQFRAAANRGRRSLEARDEGVNLG